MLDYRADSTCPMRREFIDMVQSRIGYFAFRDDATTSIRVELTQTRELLFEATVEQPPAPARQLQAQSCGELAEAAATIIALQLDPFGENAAARVETYREELTPQLEDLNGEEPPAIEAAQVPEPVEQSTEVDAPWQLGVSMDLVGTFGRIPVGGIGFGLGVLLATPDVLVELSADIELTPRAVSSGGRSLFAYSPSALLRASYRLGVLDLGASLRAGGIFVRSTELDTQVRAATSAVGAQVGLSYATGNLILRASLLGEVALNRVDVFFADTLAWSSRRVVVSLRLGVRFGVTR